MAVELATGRWAGYFQVLLVGKCFGNALGILERVQHLDTLDAELRGLERWASDQTRDLQGDHGAGPGYPSVAAARLHSPAGDLWFPTVILCADPIPAAISSRLAAIASDPRNAIAAVICHDPSLDVDLNLELDHNLGADDSGDNRHDGNHGCHHGGDHHGVAVTRLTVTAGSLQIDAPHLDLDFDSNLGGPIRPQRLTEEQYAAIHELLEIATDTTDVAPDTPPYDQLTTFANPAPPTPTSANATAAPASPSTPAPPSAPTPATTPAAQGSDPAQSSEPEPAPPSEPAQAAVWAVDAPPVEVRVLGRVEIAGTPKIERSKSIEAVVYLTLYRQGVSADRLWEVLWPGKPMINHGTLHTTVAIARRRIGKAPDGTHYVPQNTEGRYYLHPELGLDWDRLLALTHAADQQQQQGDTAAAIDLLHQALNLVRGAPFEATSPRNKEWLWTAGCRTEMETTIVDAADHLAQLCLDADEPAEAAWAARRGLLANRYDQRLYRALLRAAHARGNLAGLDSILNELLQVLDDQFRLDGHGISGRRRPGSACRAG